MWRVRGSGKKLSLLWLLSWLSLLLSLGFQSKIVNLQSLIGVRGSEFGVQSIKSLVIGHWEEDCLLPTAYWFQSSEVRVRSLGFNQKSLINIR